MAKQKFFSYSVEPIVPKFGDEEFDRLPKEMQDYVRYYAKSVKERGHIVLEDEQLEIEKVVDAERSGGPLPDEPLDGTSTEGTPSSEEPITDQPEHAAPAAQVGSSDPVVPGERISGDSEVPESDSSDDADVELDDDQKLLIESTAPEKGETITTEHLRNLFALESAVFAMEEWGEKRFEEKGITEYDEKDWQRWGREKTEGTGSWIAKMGIKFTTDVIPKLMGHAFKGTIYAFNKLAYGFLLGITALDQYITRRIKSFENLGQQLDKMETSVELLVKQRRQVPSSGQRGYTKEKTTNLLCIRESTDLLHNLGVLNAFVEQAIQQLGGSVKNDIEAIEQIIGFSRISSPEQAMSLLRPHLEMSDLIAGQLSGFETQSHLLTSYHSRSVLPGNAVLIAHLPNEHTKSREEWAQAYRESDMFIGIDRQSVRPIDKIDFMPADKLLVLVKRLKDFVDECQRHQNFYEKMRQQKIHQKLIYKNYFEGLIRRDSRVGLKESLIDLVTMKNNFVDKVYLPAAIDIHDYSVRVISAYMRYIARNISTLNG